MKHGTSLSLHQSNINPFRVSVPIHQENEENSMGAFQINIAYMAVRVNYTNYNHLIFFYKPNLIYYNY